MGRFDFNFDQKLTKQLEKLSNFDEIAPKILDGAIPILERRVKAECEGHVRTRIMINSIKKTGAKKNEYGWYVTVRPTGMSNKQMDENGKIHDRKEPVRNMEVMAHLEYGTSKQGPIPILSKALKDSESEVANKMQEIYNREVSE